MQEKRYQVFISSTFEDLKVERRAVQDVVVSTGDFPVQMESFPAADEDQFAFIKSLIDQCDYYVLIIAGRYGSVSEDGLSYTHKEYQYAVSKGIPVLVMLHGDRGKIVSEKSEDTDKGRERLNDFIAQAEKGRLRKTWTTLDGLKLAVREALDHAKRTIPRVGWMRGDAAASLEVLEELNLIRKENQNFREALGSLEIEVPLPRIPAITSEIVLDIIPARSSGYGGAAFGSSARVKTTWIFVFPIFYSNLSWSQNGFGDECYYIDDDESCVSIGSALAGEIGRIDAADHFKVSKATLERLKSYYIEAGLMMSEGDRPFAEIAQKVARRHLICGDEFGEGEIIEGQIKMLSRDDEIPF
ncbi:DUF4062 domain-containing protein [uncultured Roseibium sp.]|uniref:DUF4062 domain-containing protein n=1 Tax=uncultured Roseibium sp. TaxID=1936171 RepID=UPI00259AEA6F|nr:DUF4062 domain-containing protein [uncultured Roseibium sp.]